MTPGGRRVDANGRPAAVPLTERVEWIAECYDLGERHEAQTRNEWP